MNKTNTFGFLVVLAIVLGGCSSATSSSEYKSLKSEVESIQAEVDSLLTKAGSAANLDAKITELNDKGYAVSNEESVLLSNPIRRKAAVTKLGLPACKAWSYARFNLLDDYDDVSTDDFSKMIELVVGPNVYSWLTLIAGGPQDSLLVGTNQFITEVDFDNCYRNSFQPWLDDECETFDRMMLKKDVNSFKGKCIKGKVKIAQSDSLTGPCSFQGYINGDYDVRAQFGFTLDTATHTTSNDCIDEAKQLTEGRFVEFAGFAIGSYTYTSSNGSNTVPAFKLVWVES